MLTKARDAIARTRNDPNAIVTIHESRAFVGIKKDRMPTIETDKLVSQDRFMMGSTRTHTMGDRDDRFGYYLF